MINAVASSRILHALLALVLAAGVALAGEPSVDQVDGLLRRAETNLASVAASLNGRATPPTGSAGKLLARRLGQALEDLTPAKEMLEQIPAGSEGRDEAAARYTAAAEEYNRLRTILTGSSAPAPTESSEGTPLNYQQKDQLSGAAFNLREVEANAQQLTDKLEELRAVEDQLSINHRVVSDLLGVVANAQRKSGFTKDTLGQLPEGGQGVADVRQRLVNADAKVSIAAEYLNGLNTALQDLINPANYPEFDADYKRLRELSIMFARPEILQTNRPLAAETFAQAEAAKEECFRIARRYARLLQQQTDQGASLEGVGNGFLRKHAEFLAEAQAQKAVLPDEIRADLQQARRYAADAVAEQKPMWFTGGIPQTMGFAEERVALLMALDPASGSTMQAEYTATQSDLRKQADALRELIIRENTMPADRFEGPDRDKAVETAVSGWKVQQKDFKVLKVRIPAEEWARETKWTYSNGTWYFSDRSRLQVRLFIADHTNPELAIDRPINVWKDHQKNDSMIGVPLRSFEDELQPSDYILRAKVN
ncbi:MAG: hypothetical protein DHS20C14_00300 [Phycisphaeraceae bacterium]|nr:MAG: hypothetical protein DHS20C14_00300 [Phycisphaeraceae bacterium]